MNNKALLLKLRCRLGITLSTNNQIRLQILSEKLKLKKSDVVNLAITEYFNAHSQITSEQNDYSVLLLEQG